MVRVRSLHVYPVKSCRGIELTAAAITPYGLKYDRRWAIVTNLYKTTDTDDRGHVETQFQSFPELATIATEIDEVTEELILSAPGVQEPLRVRIRTAPDPARRCHIGKVQGTRVQHAEDEGPAAMEWLTRYLAKDTRAEDTFHLVWCPPDTRRNLAKDPRYGKLMRSDGSECTAFADTAQYHVASVESLEALNEHIAAAAAHEGQRAAVPMSRFRPNIVVEGLGAGWEEDTWRVVQIGGQVRMRVCMPDVRCLVTTVIQEGVGSGRRDPNLQPVKAMKQMRSSAKLGNKMVFGVKTNLLDSEGRFGDVHVGDELQVLEHTTQSMMKLDLEQLRVELSPPAGSLAAGGQAARL